MSTTLLACEVTEISLSLSLSIYIYIYSSPGGSAVKSPLAMQELQVQSLDQGDPLEKKRATHFRILAWEIPWTEEPGGLQS